MCTKVRATHTHTVQWPAAASDARQDASLTTWAGGGKDAETGVLLTNALGRGLSCGSLASGDTCHIIFHLSCVRSGSYCQDRSSLSNTVSSRLLRRRVETFIPMMTHVHRQWGNPAETNWEEQPGESAGCTPRRSPGNRK